MSDSTFSIRHRIEVEATPSALYSAISTQEGLSSWWTPMTEASPEVGTVARFRFGDGKHGPDMRIDELVEDQRVVWRCVDGPWKDMAFHFNVSSHERGAVLHFVHEGWPDNGDFYMHCNAKWGFFLAVILKNYLEKGTGAPHPQDPSI